MLKRLELPPKQRVPLPLPRRTLKQPPLKLRLISRRVLLRVKLRQRLPQPLRKLPQKPPSSLHLLHKLRIMMKDIQIQLSCHIQFFQILFITIKCKRLIQSLDQKGLMNT
jgi:hypothetical protein